jgi:hypothetical protein
MSEVNSITEIEYRPIAGFPGYRVGSDGSVWSSKRSGSTRCNFPWKCKSPGIDTNGYPFVKLYGDDLKIVSVHRLVLEAFIGPCPEGMEACHNNGVRTDNRVENLRWDTHDENMHDAFRHGTLTPRQPRQKKVRRSFKGEASPQAKLTDDAVRIILSTPQKWGVCAALSRQFGVSAVTILRVRQRKLWTHVT